MKIVSDDTMQRIASKESLLKEYKLAYTDYMIGQSRLDERRVHQAQSEMAHVEKMALSVWGKDFWTELRQSVGLDVY